MTKRDKIMVVVAVILIMVLLVKSFVFDNYTAANDAEAEFMAYVEEIIEEKYDGGIFDFLVVVKIVKISEMNDREKQYKDLDGNMQTTTGTYKAKIRKYILGILPYSEESILEGVTK